MSQEEMIERLRLLWQLYRQDLAFNEDGLVNAESVRRYYENTDAFHEGFAGLCSELFDQEVTAENTPEWLID